MKNKSFEDVLNENGSLVYTGVGISMRPLIRAGKDIIYIKKHQPGNIKKYDVVLFMRPNAEGYGKYVLHRILRINQDGTYWIVGDNQIGGENVTEENILGVLTALKRGKRTITVNDFFYKVYVYIWCVPYRLRFLFLRGIRLLRRICGKVLRSLKVIS